MIQKEYVLQMARYNAWQNSQLRDIVRDMDEGELRADRGAFFGSLFATLNHVLFGDSLWMGRFCSDMPVPAAGVIHTEFAATAGAWDVERSHLDGAMLMWAETPSSMDLCGDIDWYSGAEDKHFTQPLGLCVINMFNHQTHHRGQISQMLSAQGIAPPVSDLIYMPEDA